MRQCLIHICMPSLNNGHTIFLTGVTMVRDVNISDGKLLCPVAWLPNRGNDPVGHPCCAVKGILHSPGTGVL